jgi:hypothetical protein
MPSWKKVIVSGSNAALNSLTVTNGITGSLFGTASYATSASQAITASYANFALTASNSQNAQDVLIYVKNTSGAQINKGRVVRISGATGDNALISTASYESDGLSANTLGITNQDIPNDSFGYVITEGTLIGINTNAFSAGQLLYLGAAGSIIGTAPIAPLHAVRLGQVLRVQTNNGSMYVRIDNGYELGELHDVVDTTTTSSYGDLLVKSGSVWINSKQLTGSYGLTGSLNATSFTGSLLGTSSYTTSASQAISSSFATNASSSLSTISSSYALTASYAVSASYEINYETSSSYAENATSASFAINASSSLFAVSSSRAVSSSFATLAASATTATTATNANTASNITPAITNTANNRVLTDNGGGTINAESALTFDGSTLTTTGTISGSTIYSSQHVEAAANLRSLNSSGDEGGEIFLNKAATNTSITGGVTIDVWQNRLRFFEQGGTARGYFLDISSGSAGVSTNLASGGGTVTSVGGTGTVNGLTLSGNVSGSGNLTLGGTLSGIGNAQLTNSSITVGSTNIALGATSTTLAGLSSVTSTTFVGALTGNASTATTASYANVAQSVLGTIINASTASNITPAITNTANNRVLTDNGGGTINAESTLTFNGTTLALSGSLNQGNSAQAIGLASHAEGLQTYAVGDYSHAEGQLTVAKGTLSHAEGWFTSASGDVSHTEGYYTSASGLYSHAEGSGSRASGNGSHAEGELTLASGSFSHAEGSGTTATGYASHAEGEGTISIGDSSHAEGQGSIASGSYSHAEGEFSYASGYGSHAAGYYTSASGNYQSVIGIANQSSTNQGAFIIGNGLTNLSSRSNLLYASGSRVEITGSLYVSRSDNPNKSAVYTTPGTKTEPAYTFIGDDDTGMFRFTTNTVALSGGGNIGLQISDTELRLNPGTTTAQDNILMASNDTVPLISKTPLASVSVGNATLASTATIALSTNQSVTFNNAGSGDASGTTFNGGTARTISHNTIGAVPTGRTITINGSSQNLSANSTYNVGTVTSIATNNGVTGGTITSTGTIGLATAYGDTINPYASKTANNFLAAPNGSSGVPSFRAIVAADIPTLNQNTTGTATNATNAANVAVTDTTTGTGPYYLMFADGTTGNRATRVDSSTLTFNATTNTLTVPNVSATSLAASSGISSATLNVAGNGASADPYGTIAITEPANSSNYSYYGLTRAGQIGAGFGITGTDGALGLGANSYWFGTATSGFAGTMGTAWLAFNGSSVRTAGSITANGTLLTGNTGTVTSVGGTGTVNGITLTGTVSTTGNLTLGGTLGSIANSQLVNSAIQIGSTVMSLGNAYGDLTGLGTVRAGAGTAGAPSFAFTSDTNTGMYNAAADTLGFSTAGGERMRINSSGYVSIGSVISPALLYLGPNSSVSSLFAGTTPGVNESGGYLNLYTPVAGGGNFASFNFNSVSATDGDAFGVSTFYCNPEEGFIASYGGIANGSPNTGLTLNSSGASLTAANNADLNILAYQNSDINIGTYSSTGGAINLLTRSTSSLYIDTAQNVGVGTTAPLLTASGRGNITINGSSQSILTLGAGGVWKSYLWCDGTNTDLSAAGYLVFGTNGGTERLRITTGGAMGLGVNPTNTAGRFEASNDIVAYSTSDKRWKNNIVKIDSPLEKISQISGVEFDWIEDEPFHGNKGHDVGVIAQEIELVIPEAVQTRESGMKAVQYDKIIPLLIESIKEQQKQIDELKELVNKLTK